MAAASVPPCRGPSFVGQEHVHTFPLLRKVFIKAHVYGPILGSVEVASHSKDPARTSRITELVVAAIRSAMLALTQYICANVAYRQGSRLPPYLFKDTTLCDEPLCLPRLGVSRL